MFDDTELRTQLIDTLVREGWIATGTIEEAMRTVPRHLFLPDVTLEEAYQDKNVPTKTGPDGECLSSASAPHIVALMLEQLQPTPGMRILEIGAGTGYNATLLTHLGAHVTTIDIDPDAVAHTRKAFERVGIEGVTLVEGDGNHGVPPNAPYDAIIVTAAAWDIPPAWIDQLTEGGFLVVPLRFRGTTRAVAFQRNGDQLVSRSVRLCGFIPMRGSDDGEIDIDLGGNVTLRHDDDQQIDPTALETVLDQPRHVVWSGVQIGAEPLTGIWGRLAVVEPGTCRIAAENTAVRSGRANPPIPMLSPAIVDGDTLAYLAHRPTTPGHSELGAYAHGPNAQTLCTRLNAHIRAWDTDRDELLHITAIPHGTTPSTQSGRVITKHHITLILEPTASD
ncbi:methyltransferase, FxLD system [Lipingzhangella sp. LS1_29]|uniref:Protein-L-isoaspartate O-methyltransferase n=1 Tax=Lipingzhangella rawalii TaxID=2055835 RepID=A0ABU2H1U9_9ACTN|nr:methyltransferase, FxLD system [Lipingzhangella rawalii]MDS1269268.1 methyltransferase, FxLD system [Lipingzhangella rawalii]